MNSNPKLHIVWSDVSFISSVCVETKISLLAQTTQTVVRGYPEYIPGFRIPMWLCGYRPSEYNGYNNLLYVDDRTQQSLCLSLSLCHSIRVSMRLLQTPARRHSAA